MEKYLHITNKSTETEEYTVQRITDPNKKYCTTVQLAKIFILRNVYSVWIIQVFRKRNTSCVSLALLFKMKYLSCINVPGIQTEILVVHHWPWYSNWNTCRVSLTLVIKQRITCILVTSHIIRFPPPTHPWLLFSTSSLWCCLLYTQE